MDSPNVSISKIKSMTTEQLKQVKVALNKILNNGTHRVERDAYKAALLLVTMEIEHRKRLI